MKKKAYQTLSKLIRHQMYAKRAASSQMQGKLLQNHVQIQKIAQNLDHEKKFVENRPDLQNLFELFRRDLGLKRTTFSKQRRDFGLRLSQIQEQLNQLFHQKKTYELPYENKQRTEALIKNTKEQQTLDELALTIFRRSQKNVAPRS